MSGRHPDKWVALTCPVCQKSFEKCITTITSPIVYCSCSCRGKAKGGILHSNWRGGRSLSAQGYVMVRINGKTIKEHRYVMENHLGRKLSSEEHVHHKNSIKTDNRIENLEILSNREHGIKHDHYTEMRKKIKRLSRWSIHYDKCVMCNSTRFHHEAHGKCVDCYSRSRNRRKVKVIV